MKLRDKLITLRKQAGLTQLELAEQMDTSRQAVSRWETGDAVPSVENLKYLSRLYGVTIDTLLSDERELEAPQPQTMTPPAPGAPAKGRKTGLWVVVAVLITLLVVGGGLWLKHWHDESQITDLGDAFQDDLSDVPSDEFTLTW